MLVLKFIDSCAIFLQASTFSNSHSFDIAFNILTDVFFFFCILNIRGMLALSRGLFEEAHRHFLAATKLDPNNTTVSIDLPYLLMSNTATIICKG